MVTNSCKVHYYEHNGRKQCTACTPEESSVFTEKSLFLRGLAGIRLRGAYRAVGKAPAKRYPREKVQRSIRLGLHKGQVRERCAVKAGVRQMRWEPLRALFGRSMASGRSKSTEVAQRARREHGAHRGVPTLSTVVPSLGTPAGALRNRVVALLVRSIGSFPSPSGSSAYYAQIQKAHHRRFWRQ